MGRALRRFHRIPVLLAIAAPASGASSKAAYDAVLRAARSGTISLVDLKAASYARILKLKSRL